MAGLDISPGDHVMAQWLDGIWGIYRHARPDETATHMQELVFVGIATWLNLHNAVLPIVDANRGRTKVAREDPRAGLRLVNIWGRFVSTSPPTVSDAFNMTPIGVRFRPYGRHAYARFVDMNEHWAGAGETASSIGAVLPSLSLYAGGSDGTGPAGRSVWSAEKIRKEIFSMLPEGA